MRGGLILHRFELGDPRQPEATHIVSIQVVSHDVPVRIVGADKPGLEPPRQRIVLARSCVAERDHQVFRAEFREIRGKLEFSGIAGFGGDGSCKLWPDSTRAQFGERSGQLGIARGAAPYLADDGENTGCPRGELQRRQLDIGAPDSIPRSGLVVHGRAGFEVDTGSFEFGLISFEGALERALR